MHELRVHVKKYPALSVSAFSDLSQVAKYGSFQDSTDRYGM